MAASIGASKAFLPIASACAGNQHWKAHPTVAIPGTGATTSGTLRSLISRRLT
jgi:hypothetical protein